MNLVLMHPNKQPFSHLVYTRTKEMEIKQNYSCSLVQKCQKFLKENTLKQSILSKVVSKLFLML